MNHSLEQRIKACLHQNGDHASFIPTKNKIHFQLERE